MAPAPEWVSSYINMASYRRFDPNSHTCPSLQDQYHLLHCGWIVYSEEKVECRMNCAGKFRTCDTKKSLRCKHCDWKYLEHFKSKLEYIVMAPYGDQRPETMPGWQQLRDGINFATRSESMVRNDGTDDTIAVTQSTLEPSLGTNMEGDILSFEGLTLQESTPAEKAKKESEFNELIDSLVTSMGGMHIGSLIYENVYAWRYGDRIVGTLNRLPRPGDLEDPSQDNDMSME